MRITEYELIESWCARNRNDKPCVVYPSFSLNRNAVPWERDEQVYFNKAFSSIPEWEKYGPGEKTLGGFVCVEVPKELVCKLVLTAYEFDRFGPDFYGWDGEELFFSRAIKKAMMSSATKTKETTKTGKPTELF